MHEKENDSDRIKDLSSFYHAATSGGRYVPEECVVCMTDNKEILLLPCR